MKTIIIYNKKTNEIASFAGDFSFIQGPKKRVSHIWPQNKFKRIFFRLLRFLFGEDSRIADWTRNWKGPWIVKIIATGEILGPFSTRRMAIDKEREVVVKMILEEVKRSEGRD